MICPKCKVEMVIGQAIKGDENARYFVGGQKPPITAETLEIIPSGSARSVAIAMTGDKIPCPCCHEEMTVYETIRQIPQYRTFEVMGAKPIEVRVANDAETIRWANCPSCSYSINDVDVWVNNLYNGFNN